MKLLPLFLVVLLATSARAGTNAPVMSVYGWSPEGEIVGRGAHGALVERRLNGEMRELPPHWLTLETMDAYALTPKSDAEWRKLWVNNCDNMRDLYREHTNGLALQARLTNLLLNTCRSIGYRGDSLIDGMRHLQGKLAPKAPAPVKGTPQYAPGKLHIVNLSARLVETSSSYATVSWKATLLNNLTTPLNDLRVRFSFRDADQMEVAYDVERASVRPGEEYVVTSTTMIAPAVWRQVENYHVSTE